MTCSHCVENTNKIYIEIPYEGLKRYEAHILKICPEHDIAILKTNSYKNKYFLNLLPFDKFYDIEIGKNVKAIGFPLGLTNLKITDGVISGRNDGKIQTTAPLNPGNSGGPLMCGDYVIGINSSIIKDSSNIGFAIPILYYHIINKYKQKLIKIPQIPLNTQPIVMWPGPRYDGFGE